MTDRRLRVLVLSWHYPTNTEPLRGLWVERMVQAAASAADVQVIVPTPWVPPLVPIRALARFRRIPRRETRGSVEIHYPRVPGSVEHFTHGFDARLAIPSVLALARQLHAATPFDLIHAHFIYPGGVVASVIGRALGIPVMTSEHALWTPWLVDLVRDGRQVAAALPHIRLVTTVSGFLRNDVDAWANGRIETRVLPNVVDDSIFTPIARRRDPHELLYVGMIRKVKRVDVLLRALAEARRVLPALHLRILAANAFLTYGRDLREIRGLVRTLGLEAAVRFEGGAEPAAVAEAMRRCAFVVVSSTRRETFCSVAAESLACGTPLVLTRCGGPEEFVTTEDGVLVAPDDAHALADGILRAVEQRNSFHADGMHRRIVDRFGRAAWRAQALAVYDTVAMLRPGSST